MKLSTLAGIAVLLLAAAIRLAAINSQLWLDEIWSIRWAQSASSPLAIFTLHHDNNHWLNTLVLYCLGPGRQWWTYHVFPEITGIGTVFLGWRLASRHGTRPALVAVILLGMCEFLVEFATDARGYAPAGFFALLCLWFLEKHLAQPRRSTAALMSLSATLGILAHLTFLVILAGLIFSSALALRRRAHWPATLARTALWWAVPAALIVTLYFVDIRHMIRGGGPDTPADLPTEAAGMVLGLPIDSLIASLAGMAALFLCLNALRRLYHAADPQWPLYLIAVVFVIIVLFFVPRDNYIHPRYIYVATPLIFLLLSIELGYWLTRSRIAAPLVVLLILSFCAMNVIRLATFLRQGRGDYLGALAYMMAHTASADLVVATADRHPKTTLMVLEYYAQYHFPSDKPLLTLRVDPAYGQWPQWRLAEQDLGPGLAFPTGGVFLREVAFPTGAITSGIPWTVYESSDHAARAAANNLEALPR